MSNKRKPKVAWKNAPDFAEAAEALRVRTTKIFALHLINNRRARVLYTPLDDMQVFSVYLERDNDGIFQRASVDTEMPGFFEDIQAQIEKRAKEEFGE